MHFVNQIHKIISKLFLHRKRNPCFQEFLKLFDDTIMPFWYSHSADSKVLPDLFHAPILIIVQFNQCLFIWTKHLQCTLQFFQFHFVKHFQISFVSINRHSLWANAVLFKSSFTKVPPVTAVLRLLTPPVLFKIFINFFGNIYFNTIVIIFNCGFNQTQPFRQKSGKRGIAETVPQLSIPQRFAIIISIAMVAAKKSKVDLLQPHRLFYFISTN